LIGDKADFSYIKFVFEFWDYFDEPDAIRGGVKEAKELQAGSRRGEGTIEEKTAGWAIASW